jgi:integrase
MDRPIGAYLFSPQEARQERSARALVHRRPGQQANPRKTDRVVGESYSRLSYTQTIRRACQKYNAAARSEGRPEIPVWHPNQLRHAAATRIRQDCGLDAAQAALGHARADITQVYAELDTQKALAIFAKLG